MVALQAFFGTNLGQPFDGKKRDYILDLGNPRYGRSDARGFSLKIVGNKNPARIGSRFSAVKSMLPDGEGFGEEFVQHTIQMKLLDSLVVDVSVFDIEDLT
jgi:hypothetical protein